MRYLDKFIGKEIESEFSFYQEKLQEYRRLKQELKSTWGDEQEKERKLDLLHYQLEEIRVAKLRETEENELEEKHRMLQNAEKLKENLSQIDEELNENAVGAISNAIRCLEKIQDCGEEYSEKLNNLKSCYYDIQELARDFNVIKENIDFDDEERNKIENRLDLIYSLKRKYGNSILEILNYGQKVEQEINKIENLGEYHARIKNQIKQLEIEMQTIASRMSKLREKYGN